MIRIPWLVAYSSGIIIALTFLEHNLTTLVPGYDPARVKRIVSDVLRAVFRAPDSLIDRDQAQQREVHSER